MLAVSWALSFRLYPELRQTRRQKTTLIPQRGKRWLILEASISDQGLGYPKFHLLPRNRLMKLLLQQNKSSNKSRHVQIHWWKYKYYLYKYKAIANGDISALGF